MLRLLRQVQSKFCTTHAPACLDTAASCCTKRSLQTHNARPGRRFLRQAHTRWRSRPGAAAAAAASAAAGVPLARRGGRLCLPGWPTSCWLPPPPVHTIGFRCRSFCLTRARHWLGPLGRLHLRNWSLDALGLLALLALPTSAPSRS